MSSLINSFWGGAVDFTDGLVSYWKLDEGADWATAGNVFIDSQGSNDGTATSVNDTAETNIDEVANTPTDGDLLRIDITGTTDFDFGSDGAFSLSCWHNQFSPVDTTYGAALIVKASAVSGGSDWEFWINNVSPFPLEFQLYSGTWKTNMISRQASVGITGSSWEHYVVTYDGSKTVGGIKIYTNGVEHSYVDTSAGTYTGQIDGSAHIAIGNLGIATRTRSHLHDEYLVYNKELTQTEITALYNQGAAGNPIF